jgi:enoyl-CoA hydratase/carnithine racemase
MKWEQNQLLMSEKRINALGALEMGIVDQVVPYNKLEETSIQLTQDLAKRSIRSLVGIKRLINYSMGEIKNYLDFESCELLKTIGTI